MYDIEIYLTTYLQITVRFVTQKMFCLSLFSRLGSKVKLQYNRQYINISWGGKPNPKKFKYIVFHWLITSSEKFHLIINFSEKEESLTASTN